MNRKMRRNLKRFTSTEHGENLAEKIFQFNQLPQQCTTCEKEFDKGNKEMVASWKVVVRQETIRIFCPDCIDMVHKSIGENFNDSEIK
jgi:hypothetical protein